MATQFRCKNEFRRQVIREHATLNGIDYLDVLDQEAIAIPSPRQRTLLLHFLKSAPSLSADNIEIEGGVRVTPVRVLWVQPASSASVPPATNAEQAFFAALPDAVLTLAIRTDSEGDFSNYRLRLKDAPGATLTSLNLDLALTELDFSFKVECPSDFDCRVTPECPPERVTEPAINYLAKDYASFRRLMLDRLAVTMPDWRERSPADIGMALVELLAYTADHLSYYQDAVATEAYLGTARKRVSVRRHARLLDYFVHEGCNARAWVCFEVKQGSGADGFTLDPGSRLLTGPLEAEPTLDAAQLVVALRDGAVVFETRQPVTLVFARNRIHFHTWSDEQCCLPKGATRATLRNDPATGLASGDVLVFEEVLEPTSGKAAGADPAHRHAVRLTLAQAATDPVDGTAVLEIEWAPEDALPFPLCLSSRDSEGVAVSDVSVARGNVVLVDHGASIEAEGLIPNTVPKARRYRPRLAQAGVTFAQGYDPVAARTEAAARATTQDPRQALPWVELSGDGDTWSPRRDLLDSDRFAPEFVLEVESDGVGAVRFGDGVLGKRPSAGATFIARYRVGNGAAGNVGRESIRSLGRVLDGVLRVWNPLPAIGGIDPEPIARVRLDAPEAFRVQERAVTEADYARVAGLHPDVQRAAARFRWTGSWYTVFVTVDRQGGRPVDADFRDAMRAHLERYRLAGYDLEIRPPQFVPLDVVMHVCAAPGYFRSDVKRDLLRVLGSGDLPDGRRGFFHADNFSFGDAVYLSQLYAAAESVAGVDYVEVVKFQRWGKPAQNELGDGYIGAAPLEILQLANDRNFPENGKLEITVGGGL